jgi:hypothetical protein
MSAATFIYFDIVGYSKKSAPQQRDLRASFTEWLLSELRSTLPPDSDEVVMSPAGDGILLVFEHRDDQHWAKDTLFNVIFGLHQWAWDESKRETDVNIAIRMGAHVGAVEFGIDVAGKRSPIGPATNDSQRIMDAARPRQTLFSEDFVRFYFGTAHPHFHFQPRNPAEQPVEGKFVGPSVVTVKHLQTINLYRLELSGGDDWWTNTPPDKIVRPQTPVTEAMGFIAVLLVHLALVSGWLIALLIQQPPPGIASDQYANFGYCLLHYPHLAIYPLVFGWPAAYCLWQATSILLRLSFRSIVISAILIATGIAAIATRQDAVGAYMMLHEMTPEVQALGTSGGKPLVNFKPFEEVTNQVASYNRDGNSAKLNQTRLYDLFSYDKTWSGLTGWQSSSRPFYLVIVFYIVFLLVYAVALSAASWAVDRTRAFKERPKEGRRFLFYLLMAMAVLLIWVPFRIYYNISLKGPLFGLENIVDNTASKFLGIPSLGLTASEFVPGSIAVVFVYMILGPFVMPNGDRSARLRYVFIITLIFILGMCLIASQNPSAFRDIVGIGAPRIALAARAILLGFYIWVSYQLVVLDKDE